MNNQCCGLLFVAISSLKKDVFLRKCPSLKNAFMEEICPTWPKEHYGTPCLFRRICDMVISKIKKKESQKSILNCICLFPALVAKQC